MLVDTVEGLRGIYAAVRDGGPWVGIDTEASGPLQMWKPARSKRSTKAKDQRIVDDITAELTGVSFAIGTQSWYVPVGHEIGENVGGATFRSFWADLMALKKRWWFHNASYDLRVLRNYFGEYPRFHKLGDTMVLAWLTNNGLVKEERGEEVYIFGLKELVELHFGHRMASYRETVGDEEVIISGPTNDDIATHVHEMTTRLLSEAKKPGVLTKKAVAQVARLTRELEDSRVTRPKQMKELPPARVAAYAAEDALWALRLAEKCAPRLREWGYTERFDEVEMPVVRIVREMRDHGIMVDIDFLHGVKDTLAPIVDAMAQEWAEATGGSLISSSQQCAQVLYHDLKCWPLEDAPRSDKTNALSMDKEAVSRALFLCPKGSLGHRLALLKQKHAKASKLMTTYTDSILKQMPYRPDRRVRCNFSPVGTKTGRFNSKDPNTQNLPKPSKTLPSIRKAFVAAPGHSLGVADYRQLEACVMAHFSRDPVLYEICMTGQSIHDIVAEALGLPRETAKTVVFAKQYGGSATRVAIVRNIPLVKKTRRVYDPLTGRWVEHTFRVAPEFVQEECRKYDEKFEGVVRFREQCLETLLRQGYVETLFGRRGYVRVKGRSKGALAAACRQATSFVVQGSAADIVKKAMVDLDKHWKEKRFAGRMLAQEHDAIVVETPKGAEPEAEADMTRWMVGAASLLVPLAVEVKWGPDWAACK